MTKIIMCEWEMKNFYYLAVGLIVAGIWFHYIIFENKLSVVDWGLFLIVFGFSMVLLVFISLKSC